MIYHTCDHFTLEEDGVQVVPDILSPDEIRALQAKMWQWLHFKTRHTQKPVVQQDESTYASLFQLLPKHGMLFQHWDFGHNPLSWTLRQHSRILQVFQKIWRTDQLLTSFDGLSISLPCEVTHRGWHRYQEWFHTDQSFQRNGFECVQGFVNLFDVHEGDATLRVLRKSHTLHGAFQHHFQILSRADWCRLAPNHKQFYVERLGADADVCVQTKAGSVVLWDSRNVHQGMEPQKGRAQPNIRCTPYLCMTPAAFASQRQLKKRIDLFEKRRTSNHWPHKIKVFPETPRTYGKAIPRVDRDILEETELMRHLVGYPYLKSNEDIPNRPQKRKGFLDIKSNGA